MGVTCVVVVSFRSWSNGLYVHELTSTCTPKMCNLQISYRATKKRCMCDEITRGTIYIYMEYVGGYVSM